MQQKKCRSMKEAANQKLGFKCNAAALARAIANARSNVRRGRMPTEGFSASSKSALDRFEAELLRKIAASRALPKTLCIAGHRMRIRPVAGGALMLVTTYFHEQPIIGIRPMPTRHRQKAFP